MAWISLSMTHSGCVTRSVLCSRSPCCLRCPLRRTSCTVPRSAHTPASSRQHASPTRTISSSPCHRATTHSAVSVVSCSVEVRSSALPLLAPFSRTRKFCFSTRRPARWMLRARSWCRRRWIVLWWAVPAWWLLTGCPPFVTLISLLWSSRARLPSRAPTMSSSLGAAPTASSVHGSLVSLGLAQRKKPRRQQTRASALSPQWMLSAKSLARGTRCRMTPTLVKRSTCLMDSTRSPRAWVSWHGS
mmetsp:Transcript_4015/g.9557  ORF Transcript_4015/g.9557 Transcript_4015/m.9557 type:complete len:245 (+) Transcript_4015:1402-2136(+)